MLMNVRASQAAVDLGGLATLKYSVFGGELEGRKGSNASMIGRTLVAGDTLR
jgi:hypothetical protein